MRTGSGEKDSAAVQANNSILRNGYLVCPAILAGLTKVTAV